MPIQWGRVTPICVQPALPAASTVLSAYGALAYVIGRTIYMPLYAAGIPWLRSFSWNLATAGLAAMIAAIVV